MRCPWGDRILVRHWSASGRLMFAEVGHVEPRDTGWRIVLPGVPPAVPDGGHCDGVVLRGEDT